MGGFVRIAGENEAISDDPDNFASKSLPARASIISAGVLFNVILAFIIFSAIAGFGVPVDTEDSYWSGRVDAKSLTVVEVLKNSPAEKSGFKMGDEILTLKSASESVSPRSTFEIQEFTKANAGGKVDVEIKRRSETLILSADLEPDLLPLPF